MRYVKHADSFFLQCPDTAEQDLYFSEGERAGRFIQNQNTCFPHKASQNLHELLFCNGKCACLSRQIQLKPRFLQLCQQCFMEYTRFLFKSDQNVFLYSHILKDQWLLWHHINTCSQCCRRFIQIHFLTINKNVAFVFRIKTHDDLHQGTFTSAISTNQSQDLSMIQCHIDPFQHCIHSKRLIYAFDFQQMRIFLFSQKSTLLSFI